MTTRPAFFIGDFVKEEEFNFKWHSGFALSQKQKCINELHSAIHKKNSSLRILEISSKSNDPYGAKLSAFNLSFLYNNRLVSVESAFQSSKVFENGGPYKDILYRTSQEAKKDLRIKNGRNLQYFDFYNKKWDISPTTSFYDWLYINALSQPRNKELAKYIINFDCFTDIEFNPKKSFNCQAHSAALYKYLYINDLLKESLSSKDNYLMIITNRHNRNIRKSMVQASLTFTYSEKS